MSEPILERVYLDKCKELGTPIDKEGVRSYRIIDQVIREIEEMEEKYKKMYVGCLKHDIFMAIPVAQARLLESLADLPHGYYDAESEDGTLLYYSQIPYDSFRASLLSALCGDDEETSVIMLRWRYARLKKYYNLGLQGFIDNYKF